jgi:hypothetical protein
LLKERDQIPERKRERERREREAKTNFDFIFWDFFWLMLDL